MPFVSVHNGIASKRPHSAYRDPGKTLEHALHGSVWPVTHGEYLLLVQDLHSRFPEVAITPSTSAKAVIPALDRILGAYGTPEVLGSDNGPPFNSTEFKRFSKKLGFHHRKITPLAPWVNGTAERFMQNLAKVVQIAHAEKKNWRHELTKYLRAYRATPHSMMGVPPASLVFNGRKYQTNLPEIRSAAIKPDQQDARETDRSNKAKMQERANKGANVKPHSLQVGDQVLLKQRKMNKLSTCYEREPYTVQEVKGTQITAANQIHQLCRHANLFKKLPPPPTVHVEEANEADDPTPDDPMPARNHVVPINPPPSSQQAEPGPSQETEQEEAEEIEEVTTNPLEQQQQGPRRAQRETRGAPPVRFDDQDWV